MAESSSPAEVKRTNSEILWDLAHTFSDEAQSAAKRKVTEQGYPVDRGEIPFEETLINLSRNRDVLLKSIKDAAVPLLPLKIQTNLVADVRKVATQLTSLIAGNDAVLPFEGAVDDLTATIWYSNLQNMSGQVLGLHEKLNQLKTLEKSLRDLNQRAESFKGSEERASKGLARLDEALISVEGSTVNLAKITGEAQQKLEATTTNEQKSSASVLTAQQNEKSASESAATARASSAEVDALRTRANSSVLEVEQARSAYIALSAEVTAFKLQVESDLKVAQEAQKNSYAELDSHSQAEFSRLSKAADEKEITHNAALTSSLAASKLAFETEAANVLLNNKKALDSAEGRAKSIVDESEIKTKERFEELIKLEDIIREKIRLATNFELFHAFNTRQLAIAKGKEFWRNALFSIVGLSFLLSVAFVIYLFRAIPSYNVAFFLKLSISIPIVYAIHFCSGEYSKERKLEEEYAFKGNISISLEPYRELVEKMIDKGDPKEAAKYSDFVIASIDKVFTSPTQQIFGTKETKAASENLTDTPKELSKILGSVNDLVQSLKLDNSSAYSMP